MNHYCPGEGGSGDSRRDHGGRGHKKPRLVWTAELHARFMNAVTHLVRPSVRLLPRPWPSHHVLCDSML